MSQKHLHHRTQKQTERLFVTGLRPRALHKLHQELDRCSSCADHYNQLFDLESRLCSREDGLNHFAFERAESVLFDRLNSSRSPKKRTYWGLWVGAISAAAAILALVLLPLAPSSIPHRVPISSQSTLLPLDLAPKSGTPGELQHVGIRIFKVTNDNSQVSTAEKVVIDDTITFTYTYTEPHSGYLALFGIQKSGEILWYYPDYGAGSTHPIAGDAVDEPLGDGIDLTINHQPGLLRITALFSETPLSTASINRSFNERLRPKKKGTLDPFVLETDLPNVLEHTFLMEIEGAR